MVYLKISHVSWTLEAMGLYLKILQSRFWKITGVAWHNFCWATCQIFKRLENLKDQSHAFLLLVKNKYTVRYCHFWPHHIRTTQMSHGPPNDPPWMVRWATQDFRLWTALYICFLKSHLELSWSHPAWHYFYCYFCVSLAPPPSQNQIIPADTQVLTSPGHQCLYHLYQINKFLSAEFRQSVSYTSTIGRASWMYVVVTVWAFVFTI